MPTPLRFRGLMALGLVALTLGGCASSRNDYPERRDGRVVVLPDGRRVYRDRDGRVVVLDRDGRVYRRDGRVYDDRRGYPAGQDRVTFCDRNGRTKTLPRRAAEAQVRKGGSYGACRYDDRTYRRDGRVYDDRRYDDRRYRGDVRVDGNAQGRGATNGRQVRRDDDRGTARPQAQSVRRSNDRRDRDDDDRDGRREGRGQSKGRGNDRGRD